MAPSSINICSGCRQEISNGEYMACATCKGKYDLACLNISIKKFLQLDRSQKKSWMCSECRSKLPKTDNSNTPVRLAHINDSAHNPTGVDQSINETSYITVRAKQQRSSPAPDCANYITEDTLRSILHQEMSHILEKKIKDLVSNELICITQQMAGFNESMTFFNTQFEEMKNSLEEKNSQLIQLEKENTNLQATMRDLTSRMNLIEQNLRESNIEINGIPENRNENLPNIVLQLTKATGNPLTDTDILHAVRVAKFNKDDGRPRAAVVKLRSPRLRDAVLAGVANFNKKTPDNKLCSHHLGIGGSRSPVFVSEHLTPTSKQLHAATRKKAKEAGYKFVWVRNGRVFVRKDEQCQYLLIKNNDCLKLMT
ncbi:uncharacterized protein LOC113232312 [Hyposmocoma kahamanoa]|uniref:uncharacterized protein LOC113232312 n=1 Tax=Hyposmocoma kahamanoa TaxID=1477025 RepID=UPI000E6D667D|nr:uncharacterized protein LOC113232312 [Hyposmocoma kahamanoa]